MSFPVGNNGVTRTSLEVSIGEAEEKGKADASTSIIDSELDRTSAFVGED